jgi:hypothetical protein
VIVKVKKTQKKSKKAMDKPWELHDDTVKKPKKKGVATGAKGAKAGSSSSSSSIFDAASAAKKGLVDDTSLLMENSNRAEDTFDARGLDQVRPPPPQPARVMD